MDLCFTETADTLECLKQSSRSWAGDIESLAGQLIRNPGKLNALGDSITMNGKPLKDYLGKSGLDDVIEVLKMVAAMGSDLLELLEDAMNILCLLALMCQDLYRFFKEQGDEKRWRDLMATKNMLKEKIESTYSKHKQIYDWLYERLKKLVPSGIQFCVSVAATIVSCVWPYHKEIAVWIACNWKVVAVGGLVAVAVAGIAALGAIAYSRSRNRNQERRE